MTPEEKSLLERTHKLAEENNSILRGIRRAGRWSSAARVIYWLIMVGIALGVYYYLQPYLISAAHIIDQAQVTLKQLGNTPK